MARTGAHRLAREVAEASRATTGKQVPRNQNELILTARKLERLLAKRRRLRRDIRRVDADIRAERRNLKALAGHFGEHDDNLDGELK